MRLRAATAPRKATPRPLTDTRWRKDASERRANRRTLLLATITVTGKPASSSTILIASRSGDTLTFLPLMLFCLHFLHFYCGDAHAMTAAATPSDKALFGLLKPTHTCSNTPCDSMR
ncbi:hypothetical protein NDU88_000312 [Pleurodeles waltl]|uniref:Uncharacterized protein n=1 Tax=Pleurodeles waltl TaxID=8319 RepID=A0AAV7TF66_PLEWA|nr:hypothetical protein NDU88_000312 [Pleurodeles waltl]